LEAHLGSYLLVIVLTGKEWREKVILFQECRPSNSFDPEHPNGELKTEIERLVGRFQVFQWLIDGRKNQWQIWIHHIHTSALHMSGASMGRNLCFACNCRRGTYNITEVNFADLLSTTTGME
jgi:hypothetical protein